MPPPVKTIAQVQTDINNQVYTNTVEAITGDILNGLLLEISASYLNRLDDAVLLNLRAYQTNRVYQVGEATIFSGSIYQCTTQTTAGAFNPANWSLIAGAGGTSAHYQKISASAGNTFDLDGVPDPGKLFLVNYNNGWLMQSDFTITVSGTTATITFVPTITTNDVIELNYYK